MNFHPNQIELLRRQQLWKIDCPRVKCYRSHVRKKKVFEQFAPLCMLLFTSRSTEKLFSACTAKKWVTSHPHPRSALRLLRSQCWNGKKCVQRRIVNRAGRACTATYVCRGVQYWFWSIFCRFSGTVSRCNTMCFIVPEKVLLKVLYILSIYKITVVCWLRHKRNKSL